LLFIAHTFSSYHQIEPIIMVRLHSLPQYEAVRNLNNLGVAAMLYEGNQSAALKNFKDAFKIIMGGGLPPDHSERPFAAFTKNKYNGDNDCDKSIYACPILLPSSPPLNVLSNDASRTLFTSSCTFILLFNLAIVHYEVGSSSSANDAAAACASQQEQPERRRQALLGMAQLLFQKCQRLVIRQDSAVLRFLRYWLGPAEMDILTMSIWNNQGQISFDLKGYTESRLYFDQLVLVAGEIMVFYKQQLQQQLQQQSKPSDHEMLLRVAVLASHFLRNAMVVRFEITRTYPTSPAA
jgi:hypothetical protein